MKNTIDESTIETYLLKTYKHINPVNSWGERSYFINPEMKLKRGSYFATIKSKDGKNDKASHLNRVGIFRLNFGLTSQKYEEMFGSMLRLNKLSLFLTFNF